MSGSLRHIDLLREKRKNVPNALRALVQALQMMTNGYQLMARYLKRELDRLPGAGTELRECPQHLEPNAHQLAAQIQQVTTLVAGPNARAGELEAW